MVPLFKRKFYSNTSVLRLEYDNSNMALGYKLHDTSVFNIVSCPLLCLQSDCVVILICCSFQCQITSPQLQIGCWILSGPIKRGQSHSQPLINQQEQFFLCVCWFHREPHSSFLNFLKLHTVICLYENAFKYVHFFHSVKLSAWFFCPRCKSSIEMMFAQVCQKILLTEVEGIVGVGLVRGLCRLSLVLKLQGVVLRASEPLWSSECGTFLKQHYQKYALDNSVFLKGQGKRLSWDHNLN